MTRLLGVDPGLRITGYGALEAGRRMTLIEAGVIEPPAQLPSRPGWGNCTMRFARSSMRRVRTLSSLKKSGRRPVPPRRPC